MRQVKNMIKAPLEEELEKGLATLGFQLGEREYIEDIRFGAQIDDIERQKPNPGIERFFWYLRASEHQKLSASDTLIFRRLANIGNLNIEYMIWGINDGETAKPAISEIIKKMEYDEEGISISRKGEESGLITLGTRTDKPIGVCDLFIKMTEDNFMMHHPNFPKYKDGMIKIYQKLNNKLIPQKEVASTVIDFLKKHKDL